MATRWRVRALRIIDEHPLVVVAAAAAVVAVYQLWWISRFRPLGTFDADEAGYMASAFRYHRNLRVGGLGEMLQRVRETHTGPLLPLLSAAMLALRPQSLVAVLAVQPLMQAVCSVAVAGTTLAISTPRRAVVGGLVALCLPAAVLSGRSYHFAVGVAALLLLAVWALLRSDRGRRLGPMLGFGAACGAMLLTRSMAVVYLPGIAAGLLVLVGRDRRVLRNLLLSAVVMLLIAAPWWSSSWDATFGYLLRYGYGDRSVDYTTGLPGGRLVERTALVLAALQPGFTLFTLVMTGVAAHQLFRRPARLRLSGLIRDHRGAVALVAIAAVGFAVLLSTSNSGKWFELPLLMVSVPAVAVASGIFAPRFRVRLGAAALSIAFASLLLVGNVPWWGNAFGDTYGRAEATSMADQRLSGSVRLRGIAGQEWWEAHQVVLDSVEHIAPDGTVQTIAGSSALVNQNTYLLAQELRGTVVGPVESVETTADDVSHWLSPRAGTAPRILIVMLSRAAPFPPDVRTDAFLSAALDHGWLETVSSELPDGGTVLVLTHPDGSAHESINNQ